METVFKQNENLCDFWNKVYKEAEEGSILCLQDCSQLGESLGSVLKNLTFCKEKNIQIFDEANQNEICISSLVLALKTFAVKGDYERKNTLNLGRPAISLPDDFQQRVREIVENGGSLQKYCKDIHMARSTFYKYVHIVL